MKKTKAYIFEMVIYTQVEKPERLFSVWESWVSRINRKLKVNQIPATPLKFNKFVTQIGEVISSGCLAVSDRVR